MPLLNPFGRELAYKLSLEPLDIATVTEYQTVYPLKFFENNADGVTVTEELSSQTFIYFGNQIFFITHQLLAPLFNLANEYMNTPTETVDLILSEFQDALRRYPQTFLVYKQFEFRINLAHVNKLLAHMTGTKLSPNRLIFS